MASQYIYSNYQYSPNMGYSSINNDNSSNQGSSSSTSPLFNAMNYVSSSGSSYSSSSSSSSSGERDRLSASLSANTSINGSLQSSSYSIHTPRLRYYLSKSFDIEDDMEFCPDIPESFATSPSSKKFNPYTATVFSPSQEPTQPTPRVHTPRTKKPLEIIHPQTKMRVGSPAVQK